MTTRWIPPIWTGETVAILATGPSMTQALADSLRKHRTIAVNHAFRVAPWADALVALDGGFFLEEFKDFAGIRLSGFEHDDIEAFYIGAMYERVQIAEGHVIEMRNSGLAAIRCAALTGPARILLAGFNPETAAHCAEAADADEHPATDPYPYLAEGLAHVIREVRAQGIEVEHVAEPSGAPADEPTSFFRRRRSTAPAPDFGEA